MGECISRIIDGIENTERIIFVSYYYNQMSIEEIAAEVRLPAKAVWDSLIRISNEIIRETGEGGIYYAALLAFLEMGSEAAECRPP